MTKQQRDYAGKRVDEILQQKLNEIRAKWTQEGRKLTREEKEHALSLNRFQVVGLQRYGSSNVVEVEYIDEREDVFHEESFNKEAEYVKGRATKIKDELFLGDSQHALNLIQEFAKI